MFTVTVTDAAGQPAEGVSISVRRVSDAAVLTETEPSLPTYVRHGARKELE